MRQWRIDVAGQPVFVPGVAFASSDPVASHDPCSAWARDFPGVEAALQAQEFSAVVILAGGRLWLRYLDGGAASPALCGHATLGVLGLFAELGCPERVFELWTPAGPIQGTISAAAYSVRMAPARAHLDDHRAGAVAECGNRFVVCHDEALSRGDLALGELRERARGPIEAGLSYGVMFYKPTERSTDAVEVLSVTIFGRALQLDRSPCGTGSCALAALLTEQGTLRPAQRLRNRAQNGEAFEVELTPSAPGRYEPVLSYRGSLEVVPGHLSLDRVASPRWRCLPMAAAWRSTMVQPSTEAS